MANDGELFRATFHYQQPGSSAVQNVFHWRYDGTPTSNQAVADAIATWALDDWGARWQELAATDVELDSVEVFRVDFDGSPISALGTQFINSFGLRTSDMLTAAVSAFMQADTAVPGRRGRKYVPGLAEGNVNNGVLDAAQLVDLALLLAEYVNLIPVGVSGVLTPGVVSRLLELFTEFLDAGSITDVPAYQRRRKPGVGI